MYEVNLLDGIFSFSLLERNTLYDFNLTYAVVNKYAVRETTHCKKRDPR